MSFQEEAEDCRRKALEYPGRPEASFLLRVAREFDRLATRHAEAAAADAIGYKSFTN
jgi:hypothetical protein